LGALGTLGTVRTPEYSLAEERMMERGTLRRLDTPNTPNHDWWKKKKGINGIKEKEGDVFYLLY